MSPVSTAVHDAVDTVLNEAAAIGAAAYSRWQERRASLRAKLAALVNAADDEIAIVPNTSHGIINIALCLPWRRRDRVLVFAGEFPANVIPWQRAAALFGLRLKFLSSEDFLHAEERGLERLARELRRGARLVAISAVAFQTGLRLPLDRIGRLCRAHGAELFVDGAQACGAVPVDVKTSKIDYLSCGGHKWLMGIGGAGFLYVAAQRARALRPHVAGWLSMADDFGFLVDGPGRLRYDHPVRRNASLFESGNYSVAACAALEASVGLLLDLGVDSIWRHINEYLDLLEPVLVEAGFVSVRAGAPESRSCILSVRPPRGWRAPEVADTLARAGIACATPEGYLRFSPHWPNDVSELNDVRLAVQRLRRKSG